MRKLMPLFLPLLLLGCATTQPAIPQEEKREPMFKATAMRLHPVFSQVRDWTGDGRPDGIEVMIEFQDQFGEPAKAMGVAILELYGYRTGYPDPRGQRLVNPYIAPLDNAAAQRSHWNRAGRAYSLQLAYPEVSSTKTYVVTATFQLADGGRFTDRIILQPPRETETATRPASPARPPGVRMNEP